MNSEIDCSLSDEAARGNELVHLLELFVQLIPAFLLDNLLICRC